MIQEKPMVHECLKYGVINIQIKDIDENKGLVS